MLQKDLKCPLLNDLSLNFHSLPANSATCHQALFEISRLNCPRENLDWDWSDRCALGWPRMVMNGPRLAGLLAVVAPYHATDFFHYGKLGPNATSTRRSRLHWRRKVKRTYSSMCSEELSFRTVCVRIF